MKSRHLLAAAVAAALLPCAGSADELETVVVTATRTPRSLDQVLASVEVLDREDIERLQARSLMDLLRGLPGISFSNNGGPGKVTSLFLRGTESDHVLVLVDGVRIGSATAGVAAIQDLPLEEVERIEVIRGPRSSLYGSEAIGGVIQIFTRGRTAPRLRASAGAGSYGTVSGSAGLRLGDEDAWLSLDASGSDSDGFNACRGRPFPPGGGCYTFEPDDDGYRNLSASLRGGYRLAPGLDADLHLLYTDADVAYDGSFVNESDGINMAAGAGLEYSAEAGWRLKFSAGRSRDDVRSYLDGTFMSRFLTERDQASLQGDLPVGRDGVLTLGADWLRDRIGGNTPYTVDSRDDLGLFGEIQGTLGGNVLQAALRRDDDEQFGGHTTGSLAWGRDLGAVALRASFGTAYKAPTFNDLYYPGFGNPDLRPETSRTWELGLRGALGGGTWNASVYQTEVDDLIGFDFATFLPANIDEARIRGLELAWQGVIGPWRVQGGATLLDAENRSGFDAGNELPRRAPRSLRVDIDRDLGDWAVGGTILAESRRYDDLGNTTELGGYGTVDLRAEYRLGADWRLQGRVENLFDKDYETAALYNQPGRSLWLTLRFEG